MQILHHGLTDLLAYQLGVFPQELGIGVGIASSAVWLHNVA